jgi:tetratricopeptide (TPR) repeat protein
MVGILEAFRDWQERRTILREIRQQKVDTNERLRFHVRDILTLALDALERDDKPYAERAWTGALRDYPDLARASPLAFPLLLGLRRLDEAEALMQRGLKDHPNDTKYPVGLGQISEARHDVDEADKRWGFVRKRFPGVITGYTGGASALADKGQIKEAEALAMLAIKRFPDDLGGFLVMARLAVKQNDWESALSWYTTISDQFAYVGGFTGAAEMLCKLGRFDDADALMSAARLRFGTDPGPIVQYAKTAEARGDTTEAITRWKMVLQRFPLNMHVHFGAAEAFERLGEPAEAEAALRAAVERFETEERPMVELAKYFHFQRHDSLAAAEAWAQLRGVFHDNQEAYTRGADALSDAGRHEEAEALRAEHHARFVAASNSTQT